MIRINSGEKPHCAKGSCDNLLWFGTFERRFCAKTDSCAVCRAKTAFSSKLINAELKTRLLNNWRYEEEEAKIVNQSEGDGCVWRGV